jgi:NAD(P)H dehydrogenase (quinone)
MMLPLFHHGMVLAGIPYTSPELNNTQTGGTPYGVSHHAGKNNSSTLSQDEIQLCQVQGKRITNLAISLQSIAVNN